MPRPTIAVLCNAVSALVLTLSAHAADISLRGFDPSDPEVKTSQDYNYGRPFILFDGEVQVGDFDAFKASAAQLVELGFPIVVKLESPGGDVAEALRIADFVSQTWATTWVKGRTAQVNDADRSIVTCDSACAIIFFAGAVRRYSQNNYRMYETDDPYVIPYKFRAESDLANQFLTKAGVEPKKMESIPPLGLHRPYFSIEFNRSLSGKESRELYAEAESTLVNSLRTYGVADALIERMMRTPSTNVDRIGNTELFEHMSSTVPWYDEWILARCGKLEQQEMFDLLSARTERSFAEIYGDEIELKHSDSYFKFLTARDEQISSCRLDSPLTHQAEILFLKAD